MGNIMVYLTTTKFCVASDIVFDNFKTVNSLDIPVCSVQSSLLAFGCSKSEDEVFENDMFKICKEMAKFVIVKEKSIYIGDDPNAKTDTGLVEYEVDKWSNFSVQFFKRWNQTRTLLFEFVLYNNFNEVRGCLKGFWNLNSWKSLEIFPTNCVTIIKPNTQ
jgi:hypothetical protein